MERKLRIAFIWQNGTEILDTWEDGLAMAMKMLEEKHEVTYIEPQDDIEDYDILIYWEAPCTINGPYSQNYKRVRDHSTPSILLFAGGPAEAVWCDGFNLICVESKINKEEFKQQGRDTVTAFGINHELFRPIKTKKKYKAIHHGTCASWKRQWLLPQTFGSDSVLVGRFQHTDSHPFTYSRELGAQVIEEKKGDELVELLCASDVLVQSSDYWGGGQRATLEAMACGVPVICMEDSPKNIEYVEESCAGLIAKPEPADIQRAYNEIMANYDYFSKNGIEYVKTHWTANHYALQLESAITQVLISGLEKNPDEI